MFSLGGLVLTLAGIAFGWRALGESRKAFHQSDNAEVKLCEARVETGTRYQKIKFEFEKLVRTLEIGGFPTDKLPYYDSSWPFRPMYATNREGEKGVAEDSALEEPAKAIDAWLVRIDDLNDGRCKIEIALITPEIMSELKPGFKETCLAQSQSIESETRELERAVKSLAGTQHEYLVSQTEFRRYLLTQLVAVITSFTLFFGGLLVFGRSAKYWGESIRRSEPTIATTSATAATASIASTATKLSSTKSEVHASNEVLWFMRNMGVGLVSLIFMFAFFINHARTDPAYAQYDTSREIPKDFLTIQVRRSILQNILPIEKENVPPAPPVPPVPTSDGWTEILSAEDFLLLGV